MADGRRRRVGMQKKERRDANERATGISSEQASSEEDMYVLNTYIELPYHEETTKRQKKNKEKRIIERNEEKHRK